jgi:UDP-N-acetylmuramoylalanine--D-glutamate ligase
VLILGGVDKGNDYSMLKELVKQKVKAIVCLGKDNKRIHDAFEDDVELIVNTGIGQEAAQVAFTWQRKAIRYCYHRPAPALICLKIMKTAAISLKLAVKEL